MVKRKLRLCRAFIVVAVIQHHFTATNPCPNSPRPNTSPGDEMFLFSPASLCLGFLFLMLPPPPPPPSLTHNSVAHTHTTLIVHTQLCHTPSFTHNFDTLSFTHNFVKHSLSHAQLCLCHTRLWHPPSFTLCHTPTFIHNFVTHNLPWFCVASVALVPLGWLWRRAWAPLIARGAAALCVAGLALNDIHLRFTWKA